MEWIKLLQRGLAMLLVPFAFAGCAALVATPVTGSIWLIWFCLALIYPDAASSWYGYTHLIVLQLWCVAAFGLAMVIMPYQTTGDLKLGFLVYSVMTLLGGGIWLLARRGEPALQWLRQLMDSAFVLLIVAGCLVFLTQFILLTPA